ncbi:hypothetical protein RDWZM_006297 [Blomia tropicalis]|uniref:PPM-type phosphatase domain-containing protein n=1 Tax=Blomia tropicalis TaxID=40697 RepID=A0A9Q0M7D8_BLOTA|nr:hypothetical protein RDWZM_006297 [Blomia tropicalis]
MSSTSSTNDLQDVELFCGQAQSGNLLYSRNYEKSRPFREHNMHQNFTFKLDDHYVYAILTGFGDIDTVKYYRNFLETVISESIQKRTHIDLDCQKREQFYTKLLLDAFAKVEEQFRQYKNDELSAKTVIDIELEGNNPENYPSFNERLQTLSKKLSPGLSAVISLIYKGYMYVANIGDTQAYICKNVLDQSGNEYVRTVKLSTTHDLNNESEIRRLASLGLKMDQKQNMIGNMHLTRCLGNFWLKSFYKDFPLLSIANQDPISAEPDVTTIAIDHTCLFLILTSASLIEALREASENDDVSDELIKMVNIEFQKQNDLECIAKSVLAQIRLKHHTSFEKNANLGTAPKCRQIDDITLIIRDLRYSTQTFPQFDPIIPMNRLKITVDQDENSNDDCTLSPSPPPSRQLNNQNRTITDSMPNLGIYKTTESVIENDTQLNEDDVEIDAYVDFTDLLIAYNEMPQSPNVQATNFN